MTTQTTTIDVYNPCAVSVKDICPCSIPNVNNLLYINNPVLANANIRCCPNLMYFFEQIQKYDARPFSLSNKQTLLDSINKFTLHDLECILYDLNTLEGLIKHERDALYVVNATKKLTSTYLYNIIPGLFTYVLSCFTLGKYVELCNNYYNINSLLGAGAILVPPLCMGFIGAYGLTNAVCWGSNYYNVKTINSLVKNNAIFDKYDEKYKGVCYLVKLIKQVIIEKENEKKRESIGNDTESK
jgi:hypothetical protein